MTTLARTQSESDIADISARLRQARLSATGLSEFPGVLPTTLDDAYAVQHMSIAAWPDRLAGFKVGGIPPKFSEPFGANWLAGAVFARNVHKIRDGEVATVGVFPNGFAAYEAEWVFVLKDIAWGRSREFTLSDTKSAIRAIHIGTEIASSPMPMINDLGPGAIISDFGNNSSVWIGPEADLSIIDTIDDVTVTVTIDGQRIGKGAANPGDYGPLGAVRFLLNHLKARQDEIDLPDELIVSSGAVTGVHDAQIGSSGEIAFEGLGGFTLKMVAKQPENASS